MSTKLATILADFTTSLATALTVGATSATLQSATDDDGVALPSGAYFFTLDGANSSKEHIYCQLSGTSITGIYSVSRQGVETSGVARAHRIGCTVSITDFGHIKFINDLTKGTTLFDASVPLGYDGTPSLTTANQFATKGYADSIASAGAGAASTTTPGIVVEASQAEVDARTPTKTIDSVVYDLFARPDTLRGIAYNDYAADSVGTDAYAITVVPAITAYAAGQIFTFKAGTANTGAATLDVCGLGAKTIKKNVSSDLVTGDILANQNVIVQYDASGNFQMLSTIPTPLTDHVLTIPLGESFTGATTPQPAVVINDLFQFRLNTTGVVGGTGEITSEAEKMACAITPRANVTASTILTAIKKGGSPGDNIQITIQTDNAGSPSGTPITNGTSNGIAGSSLTTSLVYHTFTFASAFTLTANTKYWVVFERTSSLDINNYYVVQGFLNSSTRDYASFVGKMYLASGWRVADGFGTTIIMPYFEIVPSSGSGSLSLWQSDANSAIDLMRNAMGLVNTTGSAGDSATLFTGGLVGGFSGLIPYVDYYVSTVKGAITGSSSEGMFVGQAISSTVLQTPSRRIGCIWNASFTIGSGSQIWKAPSDGMLYMGDVSGGSAQNSIVSVANDAAFSINSVDYDISVSASASFSDGRTIPIRKGQYVTVSSGSLNTTMFIPNF